MLLLTLAAGQVFGRYIARDLDDDTVANARPSGCTKSDRSTSFAHRLFAPMKLVTLGWFDG